MERVPAFVVPRVVRWAWPASSPRRGCGCSGGWAVWPTIIVCLPTILSAAPGMAFAPVAGLRAAATVTVVGFALVILLVVLPNSRRAWA